LSQHLEQISRRSRALTSRDLELGLVRAKAQNISLLDLLVRERKLPEQSNYRDWRARHLAAYQAPAPREEFWHLPDGRSIRVAAVPNSDGGVSYIYENVTEQIALESRLAALSELQGETLDHLAEAVAVFGTDGRLRLFTEARMNVYPAHLSAHPAMHSNLTTKALYIGIKF